MCIQTVVILILAVTSCISERSAIHTYRYVAYKVQVCPTNESEWIAAARRMKCSDILSSNPKNRYHCIPDTKRSKLIEFCYDDIRPPIEAENCVVLAGSGTLHQVKCNDFSDGCPDEIYKSDEVFKYPRCLEINTEKRCFVAEPRCFQVHTVKSIVSMSGNISTEETYSEFISTSESTIKRSGIVSDASRNRSEVDTSLIIALTFGIPGTILIHVSVVVVLCIRRWRKSGSRSVTDLEENTERKELLTEKLKDDTEENTEVKERVTEKSKDVTVKVQCSIQDEDIGLLYPRASGIILGCAKSGKTTLLRKLKKEYMEDDPEPETKTFDVHRHTFVVEDKKIISATIDTEIVKINAILFIQTAETKGDDSHFSSKMMLDIIDFTGEMIYYACHHIFMTSRAFYILVIDMSKKLDEIINLDGEESVFQKWTNRDFYNFWLNSIYVNGSAAAEVILVATHADGISDDEIINFFDDLFAEDLTGTVVNNVGYRKNPECINNRYFAITKKSNVDNIIEYIAELSKHQFNKRVPNAVSWEKLRFKIKAENLKITCMNNLSKFATNIIDDHSFKDAIKYFHDVGILLYLDEYRLCEIVILDIAWFISVFERITIGSSARSQNVSISVKRSLSTFNKDGILEGYLFDVLCREALDVGDGYNDVKEKMLPYMERLDLLLRQTTEHDYPFYVPCMFKREFDLTWLTRNATSSVLCFQFEKLPFFMFYRLFIACLRLPGWKLQNIKGVSCCYKNVAIFGFGEANISIVVGIKNNNIQVQICAPEKEFLNPTAARKVRDRLEDNLRKIVTLEYDGISFDVGYKCNPQGFCISEDLHFIPENSLIDREEYICQKSFDCKHQIYPRSILKYWVKGNQKERHKEKEKEEEWLFVHNKLFVVKGQFKSAVEELKQGGGRADEHLTLLKKLNKACFNGHLNNFDYEMKQLNDHSLLNHCGEGGWNTILYAAKGGNIHIWNKLNKYPVDITTKTDDWETVLHIAAKHGKFEICKDILTRPEGSTMKTELTKRTGMSVAHYVAVGGNTKILSLFEQNDVDLTLRDGFQRNILHTACYSGNYDMCKEIIMHFPEMIYDDDDDGWHAGHHAAKGGNCEILQFLMQKMKVERTTKNDRTILHVACSNGQQNMCVFILQNFPQLINCKYKGNSENAAHFTAQEGNVEILQNLYREGIDLNHTDNKDKTTLHFACFYNRLEICRFLLRRCDGIAKKKTRHGRNAAHYVALNDDIEGNEVEILELLVEHGIDILEPTLKGSTVLTFACSNAKLDLCRHLIKNYPKLLSLHLEDRIRYRNPLECAEESMNPTVIGIIRDSLQCSS